MKKIYLFLLYSFVLICASAQDKKGVDIIGTPISNTNIFFVGELHGVDEIGKFTRQMTDHVREKYGITNIVLEMGQSEAYLINRYIMYGDTTVFTYMPASVSIEHWRQVNKLQPANKQLRIYGIDFERGPFVCAIKIILHNHAKAGQTQLGQYMNSLPDSVSMMQNLTAAQKKIRVAAYNKARSLFKSERELLKALLQEDYAIAAGILENPAREQHFARRDRGMYKNLQSQLGGQSYICIAGQYHMTYANHDIHPSLIKRMVKNEGENKLTLIMEVGKNIMNYAPYAAKDSTKNISKAQGPRNIISNDSIMAMAYGQYYKPGTFTLVSQDVFKHLAKDQNKGVPTYYTFFDNKRK